jgi:rSAM/selenodomain-associated transferase 1
MRTLIIFAREPIAGRTKTRLCPPLDGQTAAALYSCFLRDTLDHAGQIVGVRFLIAYSPESGPAFFDCLAPHTWRCIQRGATLGERMDNCFDEIFAGARSPAGTGQHIVIIGSDSPDLPCAYVQEAFARLSAGADMVLGPAEDGGYYLIGLGAPQPGLLSDIAMSTPTVLADTVARAAMRGLRVALLPHWYDVDTIADLARLATALRHAPPDSAAATRAFLLQLPHGILP